MRSLRRHAFGEFLYRQSRHRRQLLAAAIKIRNNILSHSQCPETGQVLSGPRRSRFRAAGRIDIGCNFVDHLYQFLCHNLRTSV